MRLDLVQTLADLVAIDSVNPMGRPVADDYHYESRVTDYLEDQFERMGVPWQRQGVDRNRENIIARLDGSIAPRDGGAVILWEVHQDTVPVEGMTIPPWTPTVRDGRLYGRGACDVKGGMAAMLGAFARLAEERPADCPTVILACTVNEEHGYTGATALSKLWLEPRADSILPRRPDAAVVAEPTDLNVVVAHKGTARWRLNTHGRAAHSSSPANGDSAIYRMARVLEALERYATKIAPQKLVHPLCGGVTLSVGTIRGGLSVNTVPDLCTIEIDRRVPPGEDPHSAYEEVIAFVRDALGDDPAIEHEPMFLHGVSLADTHNGPVAERLAAVARELSGRGAKIGVPFGTDASKFATTGVPSIVFGPGSVSQAHTVDEWLPLDELQLAADILVEFTRRGL